MKIIHITQFLGIGGLEKIIFHLILEQQRQGHNVSLYVYDHNRDWVNFFRKNGIHIITPKEKKTGIDFSLFFNFNRDLMGADIIHSHDMNPIVYLIPVLIFRKILYKKNPFYVHTTHGMAHIERVPRYRFIEKYLTPIADKVICVSKKIENLYRDDLKISAAKIVTIENGIQTYQGNITTKLKQEKRNYLVQKHKLDPNRPILLCLSRILPLKNQKFLVECASKNQDWQLIIAGPASDIDYFHNLIKIKTSNVYFVGPQEEVADYNLGSDLFVSASSHEGLPVAVLEAMSVETPVLASNISGHANLNQYEKCIDLFEENEQIEFIDKCNRILKDPQILQTKIARKIVEEHFSVKRMVDLYLKEYKK